MMGAERQDAMGYSSASPPIPNMPILPKICLLEVTLHQLMVFYEEEKMTESSIIFNILVPISESL